RFAQIRTCELALESGARGYAEDLERIRGSEGLPLEVLNSLRLLARAREEYLRSILDYNRAQFELYVALGKPPGELLMRPAGQRDDADNRGRKGSIPRPIDEPDAPIEPDGDADALEGLSRDRVVPLAVEERLIDLPTALQLAEAENPTIALGRQAIVEAS